MCRALYTDGNEYECKIDSIADDDDSGQKFANITYVEYGNTEIAWLKDLKPSTGSPMIMAETNVPVVDIISNEVEDVPVAAAEDNLTLTESSNSNLDLESPEKNAPWKIGNLFNLTFCL